MQTGKYLTRQRRRDAGLCWDCGGAPEAGRSRCRTCLDKNKEARDAALREGRHEAGTCWDCPNPALPERTRCAGCLTKYNARVRVQGVKLRDEAMAAYGGLMCACCGEAHVVMLTIDHVAQDGAEHRRNGERTGPSLYLKLKKLGYPGGYRVLCRNCNTAAYWSPDHRCPHLTGCFAP